MDKEVINKIDRIFKETNIDFALYKYVNVEDLDLFVNRKLLKFTNPNKFHDFDSKETFFENWFMEKENFIKCVESIVEGSQKVNSTLNKYLNTNCNVSLSLSRPNISNLINLIVTMLNPVYCFCCTKEKDNFKVKEQFFKQGKNIIIPFQSSLLDDISLNKERFNTYIDLFSMYYCDDYDNFILSRVRDLGIDYKRDIGAELINKGLFIKDKKYDYEKEVRFRLNYDPKNLNHKYYSFIQENLDIGVLNKDFLSNEFYKCVVKLQEECRKEYHYKEIQYVRYNNNKITKLYVNKNINAQEKNNILQMLANRDIKIIYI